MKPKKLLTLLLLALTAVAANAAITTGNYYVKSYNGKYLTENTNSHALVCSDRADGNYAQVWTITATDNYVTFKNALTGNVITGPWPEFITQSPSNPSAQKFYPVEADGAYTFPYRSDVNTGLHCDNALNVVQYYISEEKSKWTVEKATVVVADLQAQQLAMAEATTSDLTTFFTTTACTELSSTWTSYSDADLRSAMRDLPTTTQDLAIKLKNNAWTTYSGWDKTEKTFRIADYQAYSSHTQWANILGLGYVFGQLTNPTGIAATAGDVIQVYVGTIPSGQTVKLEIAGENQATGSTYSLHEGMNTILVANSGNCFVQYEVDNTTNGIAPYTSISTYPTVTVHIEGGTVQGYFDLTKGDDNDDWASLQANLLSGSTVDIKTNRQVFHMNAVRVKAACPTNMVELLGEWTKILDMEYSLMGLEEYAGYWNNLLSATEITSSYMYATNYGTYYESSTIASVMSYADLLGGGAIWGPAHENGHVFQKYINMVGQTEVSNNVFSNVAIYNNGHLTSRAANISTTFQNMANNVFWNDRDIWERTHLYFQLYQYFHILGKKSDFYPQLFKAFRNDPMVHTGNTFISAKDDYLKFYKTCCQVSGYDLTEFFQAYGFFVIPTLTSYTLSGVTKDAYMVEDYGNYYLTVTQDEINAVKAEVAAMKLPKANIIFIEDRITAPDATYEGAAAGTKKTAFSDEYPIGQAGETGQYTDFGATCSEYKYNVIGTTVKMFGSGAVGFKVYDSTGALRGIYNTYTFTLPDDIGTGYTVKAAAGNGSDATATFDATVGTIVSDVTEDATANVKAGSQITAESQLVSGQLYLVYYVGNGNSAYMKDTGSAYTGKDDNNPTQNAVYRFTSNGDGTWKVQNYATGKYWGTPTANATTYIGVADEASAGSWALNFQSNNNIAPSCNEHSLNRSGSNIHPWSSGTDNVNQLKIEAVSYDEDIEDFTDKDISVSSDAAATLQTGQWYVMFDRGANHGYLYENGENKLYNTATVPSGSATDNAKYLVRVVGWDNEYYLQTGLGHFFGNIEQSTAVPTTTTASNPITLKKIADTDGHYYLASALGIILDANNLSQGDATVVGWGSTAPTTTGGNNDWAFYPVEFVDSWAPTISEVYTINNTNSQRGALTYEPNVDADHVWSSGKSGATAFDATNQNHQWVIVPTATEKQYYLYNVGAGKFIVNTGVGTGAANPWMFSDNAAPLTLTKQDDGTFKIKAANGRASDGTNNAIVAVSNGQTYPIMNYDDAGSYFTITKVEGADASIAATAALSKLIPSQTALTAAPTASGWYVLQIKTSATAGFVGRYVKNADSEIAYSGRNYPLTFTGPVNIHPAINDATFYTYIDVTGGYDKAKWQMPNGRYLTLGGSYFPQSSSDAATVIAGYDNGSYFKAGSTYAVSYRSGESYFIGESSKAQRFNVYPIDLDAAGLTPWKVIINNASPSALLTCTRSDVVGLTAVYPGGTFFLPTGTTPVEGDFTLSDMLSCTVDPDAKTITAVCDPELSITADDIAVWQGHQVTGKGNTMQPLLRIKATPFADFQPTQFGITLSGAAQADNVKVYSTTGDQINAAGANPVLLGSAVPAEGTVNIDVTDAPSVAANTPIYYWITADVKSAATEWETIDAALTTVSYTNAYKTENNKDATTLDLAAIGNPDGEMRIYNSQSTLWTSTQTGSKYYRIPALLKTATNTLLAFTDDRYASTSDLGSHKIDVLVKKSTDGGRTWGEAITVAAGDGSSDAAYGYGDAAVAQATNGDIVCLMAAGKTGFPSGMKHIGYTKSTDGGATWSTPVDIYDNTTYLNNPHATGTTEPFTSTFVSSGHGITQKIAHEGRIAFPALGKISSGTNEYVIYSDDNGATWTFTDNYGYAGADESKLEEMNDGTLLMSIRTGGFNSSNVARGYNRTTATDVENWGTQGTWSDLTANGCNSDLIYYTRATDGERDVLLHSVVKSYSNGHRKDLRLYMSFDQGATWQEAFQLQPGWAAYSSMQILDNGDLAILFEDGSIGNEDKGDCYDINYVTISAELMAEKIEELYEESFYTVVKNSVAGSSTGCDTYGTLSNAVSVWNTTWTSKAAAGVAGLTVVASANDFAPFTVYNQRIMAMRPSADGATDEITITAPDGYIIDSYTITGRNYSRSQTYQLYVNENSKTTTSIGGATFSVNNINAKSTSFKFYGSSATNNYLCVTNFTVKLAQATTYTRNVTSGKWGTVCVAGAVSADNIEGADIYRIAGKTLNASSEPTSLKLEQVTTMEAGVPYFFQATDATLSLTYADATAVSFAKADRGLVGSLKAIDVAEGKYLLSNGEIVKCGTGCSIAANRAYIDMENVPEYDGAANVKTLGVFIDTATGITEMADNERTNGACYDLSGRRVANPASATNRSSLPKGIYIIDGRKVVVR